MPKQVTVYSAPTCLRCIRLKRFLEQHGIPFREVNVAEDEDAAEDLFARSHQQSVPVLEVDGRIVVGFDRERLTQMLGLAAGS